MRCLFQSSVDLDVSFKIIARAAAHLCIQSCSSFLFSSPAKIKTKKRKKGKHVNRIRSLDRSRSALLISRLTFLCQQQKLDGESCIYGPIEPDRARSGQIGPSRIGSGRIGSGRIGSHRIASDRIGSGRISSLFLSLTQTRAHQRYGELHTYSATTIQSRDPAGVTGRDFFLVCVVMLLF